MSTGLPGTSLEDTGLSVFIPGGGKHHGLLPVPERLLVLEKDQVEGGQEAPGKLGHRPRFPTNPAKEQGQYRALVWGEGGREGGGEGEGAARGHWCQCPPYHGVLVVDLNDNDGGIVA